MSFLIIFFFLNISGGGGDRYGGGGDRYGGGGGRGRGKMLVLCVKITFIFLYVYNNTTILFFHILINLLHSVLVYKQRL